MNIIIKNLKSLLSVTEGLSAMPKTRTNFLTKINTKCRKKGEGGIGSHFQLIDIIHVGICLLYLIIVPWTKTYDYHNFIVLLG